MSQSFVALLFPAKPSPPAVLGIGLDSQLVVLMLMVVAAVVFVAMFMIGGAVTSELWVPGRRPKALPAVSNVESWLAFGDIEEVDRPRRQRNPFSRGERVKRLRLPGGVVLLSELTLLDSSAPEGILSFERTARRLTVRYIASRRFEFILERYGSFEVWSSRLMARLGSGNQLAVMSGGPDGPRWLLRGRDIDRLRALAQHRQAADAAAVLGTASAHAVAASGDGETLHELTHYEHSVSDPWDAPAEGAALLRLAAALSALGSTARSTRTELSE